MKEHYKEMDKALDAMTDDHRRLSYERVARAESSRYPESPSSQARAVLRPDRALEVSAVPHGPREIRRGAAAIAWLEDEISLVTTRVENLRMDLDQLHAMKQIIQGQ